MLLCTSFLLYFPLTSLFSYTHSNSSERFLLLFLDSASSGKLFDAADDSRSIEPKREYQRRLFWQWNYFPLFSRSAFFPSPFCTYKKSDRNWTWVSITGRLSRVCVSSIERKTWSLSIIEEVEEEIKKERELRLTAFFHLLYLIGTKKKKLSPFIFVLIIYFLPTARGTNRVPWRQFRSYGGEIPPSFLPVSTCSLDKREGPFQLSPPQSSTCTWKSTLSQKPLKEKKIIVLLWESRS